MKYIAHQSDIHTIRQEDYGFNINDGLKNFPRAGLEYTGTCPFEVQHMIQTAFARGYIRLIAHVKDNELMWETLSK
jgi:hypothetical protein